MTTYLGYGVYTVVEGDEGDHDFKELQDLREDEKGRRQTPSVGEARQMRDRGFAGLLGPTGQGILGFILMA